MIHIRNTKGIWRTMSLFYLHSDATETCLNILPLQRILNAQFLRRISSATMCLRTVHIKVEGIRGKVLLCSGIKVLLAFFFCKPTAQLFIWLAYTAAEPAICLGLTEDSLDLSLPCPKGYAKACLTFRQEWHKHSKASERKSTSGIKSLNPRQKPSQTPP